MVVPVPIKGDDGRSYQETGAPGGNPREHGENMPKPSSAVFKSSYLTVKEFKYSAVLTCCETAALSYHGAGPFYILCHRV